MTEMFSPRVTDQSFFFLLFKWQTPNERFWHFNCFTFQMDLNMTQTGAEKNLFCKGYERVDQ